MKIMNIAEIYNDIKTIEHVKEILSISYTSFHEEDYGRYAKVLLIINNNVTPYAVNSYNSRSKLYYGHYFQKLEDAINYYHESLKIKSETDQE